MKNLEEALKNYTQDPVTRMIVRVAAYVRVSTQEQKLHGISVDAQKAKLEAYAEEHGLKIVEWYVDEGVSGRKLIKRRPELQRMIQDAEQGKFDRIIFIKLDRFFRSVAEYHECMKRISPVLWTATEEDYDLTTANGRLLVNMKLTIAELEADQGGERINLVNDYKITAGQPLTGSMPFCYKIVTDEATEKKKIVKNPETEEMTYDMLRYFLTFQSSRKTLHYINDKYGTHHSYNTLANLLRNALLCGEYRGNPAYIEDPYIDKETFVKIQEILKKNVRQPKSRRTYLFTGLIKCPECGKTLRSSYNFSNANRNLYQLYLCNYHKLHNRCGFKDVVFEGTVEKLLLKNIDQYLKDAMLADYNISSAEVKKTKPDIKKIQAEIDRLNYSWRTGKIAKVEDYERDFEELKNKLEAAQQTMPEQPKDFSQLEAAFSGNWQDIYKALDAEHKRAFWRKYIKSIEIDWSVKGRGNKKITKVNFF
jgi:DNA invertase Pin-like site-specific DNA recombinase